jgi:hypothetical protein
MDEAPLTPVTPAGRRSRLEAHAPALLETARDNLTKEYPHQSVLAMAEPGPVRSHRERHPAFYGSYDWHSCVEMVWVVARLVRLFPGLPGEPEAREVLDRLLTADNLATERATFAEPAHRGLERPYGWGWYLTLAAEMSGWEDPDARSWADHLRPLADDFDGRLRDWLPLLAYPQRCGLHPNTAFALTRAWPFAVHRAEDGRAGLAEAIRENAERLFAADTDYPLAYEPSAADFLSPALTEATLMAAVWSRDRFAGWLGTFLPGLEEATSPLRPVVVADPADGQLAHFSGLNLSRAAAMVQVAEALGEEDPRHVPLLDAAGTHLAGSLEVATQGDYMITHWAPAFVLLALS